MFRIECARTDTSRGSCACNRHIITRNCTVTSSCFDGNNSSAADSGDLIRSKCECSTGGRNIVVTVTKAYIQLQVRPNPDILVAGIGNPIVKLSGSS